MNEWVYDELHRNNYETDFSFLNTGENFPTKRMKYKNAEYRFRRKEYSGKYGGDRYLVALINNVEKNIPYKVISLNYFRLLTNKLVDLMMNNDISIKTGDVYRDSQVDKLIEKTEWVASIRQALKYVTIYGDTYIKTYKNGASVFTPTSAFKLVNNNNINEVIAYVLYTPIFVKEFGEKKIKYIKFEVHFKGFIFEIVKEYVGGLTAGTLGKAVDYEYNGRKISKEGSWYTTGVNDCEMVQCLSVNKDVDSVYGESIYQDIQDIVFALEHRISMEQYALNNLIEPLLIVGMSSVEQLEDGTYRLKTINGNMLVTEDRNNDKAIIPQQFQQEFKLESYQQMIDTLKSELYELSEMGKVFLTSEYSGNISEESIDNLIKGAIDKANRIVSEAYYSIRNSLYVLCKLNDIDVNKEDIVINFNIGQTDDDKSIAEVCKILIDCGVLSKTTLRKKYFGYSEEQAIEEQRIIDNENNVVTNVENI